MTFECIFRMTCADSNLSYRDICNVPKNVNSKHIAEKIYDRKEHTYNYVMYLLRFDHDIKIKKLSKPVNFKS